MWPRVASRARRRTRPSSKPPQAISVVTRKQMDDQNVQNVPEALRYSAGVLPEQRGVSESGLEYIYGRGFMIDSYLDGLRLPSGDNSTTGYNVVSVDPYFLQSIQVLHGPASVLYGQASPGGVVDLVSKQPPAEPLHEISLQTGSYGGCRGAFDIGGPGRSERAVPLPLERNRLRYRHADRPCQKPARSDRARHHVAAGQQHVADGPGELSA